MHYGRFMLRGSELIAEGRAAAPTQVLSTRFLQTHNVGSEAQYKQQCRDQGILMWHMHVGLSTWQATEDALREVYDSLARHGHRVDRFGLALDRAMGVPEAERHLAVKETGPRIAADEWRRLGQAVPIQPHLGDYMIGMPAGFQNTLRALAAGVSTIGNIGQYSAYEVIGGSNEILVTQDTVRALGAMAARRDDGALAHSNLEDGSATQATHFGGYIGWAALELYVVEELIGARLAHCFGNTIQSAEDRAIVHFALDDLRNRDSIGSMIYGNTVDHRAGNNARNTAAVSAQLICDIALQLRRPTGHAINPVPLSEAERIPSPAEIVEVHLLARELEHEVRKAPDLYDWNRLERLGAVTAAYGRQFCRRALASFANEGIDITDAAQVLLALRRATMLELEERVDLDAPDEIRSRQPWKSANLGHLARRLMTEAPRLNGVRVVLAVLEVHDLVRDALAKALPAAGAEVILLGSNASVADIVRAAADEDADAIVLGAYNGNALHLAEQLVRGVHAQEWDGRIFMGGVLNQDTGEALPIDARPGLAALGVQVVERVEDLFGLLAH